MIENHLVHTIAHVEDSGITYSMMGDSHTIDPQDISDGYHTFRELYQHRTALWIAVAAVAASVVPHAVYRFHHYTGWFCLGIETKNGQCSYHLPESEWDKCSFAEERQPEFDGHTSQDVLNRLGELVETLREGMRL